MNIFDILSNDERIIVLSSLEYVYTWNQSVTLQCWHCIGPETSTSFEDSWKEVGIQTLSNEPSNFAEARKAAQNWHNS
jgi:hypothetical protein